MSILNLINNPKDLKDLRELYERNYSKNLIGFHVLNNFVRWFERDPYLKHVAIYAYGDKWRQESGLYLIVDRYSLFINSLIPGDEQISKALKLLDWSRGYKITALPEEHHEIVASALRDLNIKYREVKLSVYRLSQEKALNFEINYPPEYEVRALNREAAAIIDSNWYSRQGGSLLFFERLIKFNLSLGVYRRDSQELVAWCTRCQNGFLGSLCVKEAYRRQGLAELLIKEFALQLSELPEPEDVFSAANEKNEISNSLLRKMSFEIVASVYHMVAYCVPEGMEWPFKD